MGIAATADDVVRPAPADPADPTATRADDRPTWLPWGLAAAERIVERLWRFPGRRNPVARRRDLAIPMRDGVVLRTEHYGPTTPGRHPTLLVRTPYGRGVGAALSVLPFAARGYHVLIQSCRGTFGSGGVWLPMTTETQDAEDTLAWLRERPWFDGRLVMSGSSYLGYTQWAMADADPPELRAIAAHFSPHSGPETARGRGPLALLTLMVWSDLLTYQELISPARIGWRIRHAEHRLDAALRRLPIASSSADFGGSGAPWWEQWSGHTPTDEYWQVSDKSGVLGRTTVPVYLVGGWQDVFGEQVLSQYRELTARGVDVRLLLGPWTHLAGRPIGKLARETLDWFTRHLDDEVAPSADRLPRVRVLFSGEGAGWEGMDAWPPPTTAAVWRLDTGGRLRRTERGLSETTISFTYDPNDPTPSVGGAYLAASAGVRDNRALERRDDVICFSTAQLGPPVRFAGRAVVSLAVCTDHPYADLFVRLCDVAPPRLLDRGLDALKRRTGRSDGVSRNVTDQLVRLDADDWVDADTPRRVSIELPDAAHVFGSGHRIRLQVSGGAFPRFARNLGWADDAVAATQMRPTRITLLPADSSLTLPCRPDP